MDNTNKYINSKSARGFTLIEILIVVAIISILSSIILVGLGPARMAGRDARRIADLNQVRTALELYNNRCGYYPGQTAPYPPASCGPFTGPPASWSGLTRVLLDSNLGLDAIPNDISGGTDYIYGVSQDGKSYVLAAVLEDLNNSVLTRSLKGFFYGVDCSGPTYCVKM